MSHFHFEYAADEQVLEVKMSSENILKDTTNRKEQHIVLHWFFMCLVYLYMYVLITEHFYDIECGDQGYTGGKFTAL